MKKRNELRILLMQVRHDQQTIEEELEMFARHGQLSTEQFDLLNLFQTPQFEPEIIEDYDALFIGGSSDASVRDPEQYPFVPDAERMLKYCFDKEKVVFASCFGFQVVAVGCGGRVIQDIENQEIGTIEIRLHQEANSDPLLHDLPPVFWAVSGHQDRACVLPEGFDVLASSERCPYHIIRARGKPFYGTQFHPEVDHQDFVNRITRYQDRYNLTDQKLAEIIQYPRNTFESNNLIARFVDRIMLSDCWKAPMVL